MLDPLLLYGLAIGQDRAPSVPGVTVSAGDEHQLRSLNQALLQAVVDAMRAIIEPYVPGLTSGDTATVPVTFTNGVLLLYPAWTLKRRGHDLLPVVQKALGGTGVITPPALYKMLRRVRLIAVELAGIMKALQA